MFALYGISGPLFQGPMENFRQLPPVARRRPINGIRPVGETFEPPSEAPMEGTQTAMALEEYRAMLPQELDRGPLYQASQIMQKQVISVNVDDDVEQAWKTLVENQINQAPVLDENHHLVGIVSERHLLTTLNVDNGKIRDVLLKQVRDVMSTPVVAAYTLTDIRRIAQVMLDRNVDGVPIINDNGALLGFISRSDILHAVVTDPPLSIWR